MGIVRQVGPPVISWQSTQRTHMEQLTQPLSQPHAQLFVAFAKEEDHSLSLQVSHRLKLIPRFTSKSWIFLKLDGVGPVDNRPSTD